MSQTFTNATFGAGNYSAGVYSTLISPTYTGTNILSTDNVTSVTFTGTLDAPGSVSGGTLTLNTTGTPIIATSVTYVGVITSSESNADPIYILTALVGAQLVAFAITTDPSGLPSLTVATAVDNITAPGSTDSNPPCFASGTLIRTVNGDVAVEHLEVGDLVLTTSGVARPIKWLGHRTVKAGPEGLGACRPIRVTAGAFGDALPEQDLELSPGHAVCVEALDQLLIPVDALVNGTTVVQVEADEVTYWHVELESHDILFANGLPCESYMDVGNRHWFGRNYGRLETIDAVRVGTLADYARPFVNEGPVLTAVRERLAARARLLAWRQEGESFDGESNIVALRVA